MNLNKLINEITTISSEQNLPFDETKIKIYVEAGRLLPSQIIKVEWRRDLTAFVLVID